MEGLLERLLKECQPFTAQGHVATYIPELAKGNPADLGVSVLSSNGKQYRAGNWDKCFSIQSVVKPILLLLALLDNGEAEVRAHVGVEATGRPFDAINVTDQLLSSNHLNPMVNMGAIKMCTLIHGKTYAERFQRLLDLTRLLAGNSEIEIDRSVYTSEKQTGSKNRALAYLLQSNGLLNDNVEEVLDCYFKCCSIRVNSMDLANIGFVLANRGRLPHTEERVFPVRFAHYVNAIMVTCGMYNGSGEFAIQVGVPAKSGVGGGIMASVPTRMGIGIFGPALDSKGNSVAGIRLLERMSQELHLGVF